MADKVQYYLSQLDKELSKYPLALEAEKRTKVPKAYLFGGVSLVFFVLIFFNVWGDLLTDLLGFLYPAYASFKAIESSNKNDDTQWLVYWVVFGLMNVVEFFSDVLLFWVPFYYVFKAVFVLYLILPQFKGAEYVYTKFVRPYLTANEKKIDAGISKIKEKASAVADIASDLHKD